MIDRKSFESAAFNAVLGVASTALPEVKLKGFTLGSVDISRTGDGGSYQSEIRLYIYQDGQICDALEVRIWRDDQPLVDVDELEAWFREQFAALGH